MPTKKSKRSSSKSGNKLSKEEIELQKRDPELDTFQRRIEWFRDLHTDRQGFLPANARIRALQQADRLGKKRLRDLDPGGSPPTRGHELVSARKIKASIRKADNPRPNSSFGFAAKPVEVSEVEDLGGAIIKITLDEELLKQIDPATVRVFRFEESTNEWHIVAYSGVSVNADYAWAKLSRPGLYVPIGLPRDPWLLRTIIVLKAYAPWLRAARKMNTLDRLLEPLSNVIVANEAFEGIQKDSALANEVGLPARAADRKALQDKFLGLDFQEGGLPEAEILNETRIVNDIPQIILFPLFCNKWVSAGPNNINGRIKSLAIHPTNGNIVYAGGADGGVWKTVDGGATWASKMQVELSMAIGALAVSASSPDTVYAATGEDVPGWGPSFPGIGVYKTTDGGNDWDLLAPIASSRCSRIVIHPLLPTIVYVSGNAGLHKSIDGGISWTNVRTDHVSDVVMDPLSPDTLYAGVWNSGVYKTTDGGASWMLLNNGILTGASAQWIKLAMGLNGPNTTQYLVAKMGLDSGQMFKTTNGGTNWAAIPGVHQAVSYNEWTNMVAVDPTNQNVIFAGGVGLERSGNGGANFVAIGGTHSDHHVIVFNPTNSNTCYMATDGGVYKSTDNGVNWTLTSQGLVCTQLYSIGVGQVAPFILGGGTQDQGIIKTVGPTDWTNTGAGNEGGFFIVDLNNSNNVYVTPWSTNLRRSVNGGVNWTTILNGLGAMPPTVNHLAVKPGDSNQLLCVGGSKVFRTTNQGNNWSSVLNTTGGAVRVAFSSSNPSVCYAATSSGRVYKSLTSGTSGSWAEPYVPADKPPTGFISSVVVDWANSNVLYITYGGFGLGHVYRSIDGGAHWVNISGVLPSDALPDIPVSALVIDQNNPEILYVATDIGVFRTPDGGDSWEPFDDNMPRIITSELVLHKSANTLYASTMGRGAYKRLL